MTTPRNQFADDAPKTSPWRDDVLGFANFSRRLAEALVTQHAPNGYVVGLHGEWGSGKSTVVNFVKCHLQKWKEEDRQEISNLQWFDFEPWIVSGHQDLAAAFFKVLSERIGDRAEKWYNWRRRTKGAVDAGADKLIDAAASVGLVIDHTGGAATAAGAVVTKATVKKAAEKWLAEPSLQKTYGQLVDRLKKADRRFLVFIDDIDRLTSAEIRSLMQMVKTVGHLPNVTYLLSYDRQIVWSALNSLGNAEGGRSGFAEKIVQHEIEVPLPSGSALMRMLETSLVDMPPAPPMGIRWLEIMNYGLHRWIRHPRDVVRLSNAMRFAWAALKDEVDAWDVLCMEAMRLFDRKAFDWVRENRALLLGEGVWPTGTDEEKKAAALELSRSFAEGARADLVRMLCVLFPNKTSLFANHHGLSNEKWGEVVARRGVATNAGFDAYFSLAPSPFAIPRRLIEEAATPGTTRSRHAHLIEQSLALFNERGGSLARDYFEELFHRVDGFGPKDLIALLEALVDCSMQVFSVSNEEGSGGPAPSHHLLVCNIFACLGPNSTMQALGSIFERSDDVGALCSVYVDLGRALGLIESNGYERREFIAQDGLASLGAVLLPKIRAMTEEERTRLPHFYELARAWEHLGDRDAARAWLAREARRDGHSLAKLSAGLLWSSTDRPQIRYRVFREMEVDLYDIDAIAEGCDRFGDAADLSPAERARIEALAGGIPALREALADHSPQDGD
ncbi:KAP family P-loop NTPase fold protein [Novosphingobium sp. RL4]|uniref:KAP family P-loop NTPase fold protein n=1 Tax=Novosphingobium sp. RL4 TaxID=3109595 RepID=UPI002D78A12B|nr:P-loop NTPase fold protein [Novosphingobium sp. RL4]WRT94290.1 P-loop NTPase fold protein [Novosphingobium sp. RL4]